ncbi:MULTISPECIES: phosphate ABC transporter permease PstA [Ectothiorhodospira]|uniref:phosphate ABC transporter permease PstA n=1 Tax=Ectothiorhodospira TaxID=1051 RepID=UPI001EE79E2E|nr:MULTISPECIES: phosphate ABC transporter permease PstA [Ectothiorhodospira]MCG5493623.1 phosphate ABC transporter permease PstA [Ectothiorhodospira variabilis]MCG5502952.1 phosphate ABC transporter permease PstA [Ectothiorhodospira variabilis]MCG5506260.1 phosphate ABC transporter permease PstA [Ectothiorhodospira variabilis]MCG5525114.1 phosphate ABC transporter permease PstA [Ectothiorhodospira haloalkaliphila]
MTLKQWFKSGSPWVWLNAGAIAISMIMVVGLLSLILVRGFSHFWPAPILETTVTQPDGRQVQVMGELSRSQTLPAEVLRDAGVDIPREINLVTRHLIKQGNRDVWGRDFVWYPETGMEEWRFPADAMRLERRERGDFFGYPVRLMEAGRTVAEGDDLWPALQQRVARANDIFDEIRRIERREIGSVNQRMERVRLDERRLEMDRRAGRIDRATQEEAMAELEARRAELNQEFAVLQERLDTLYQDVRRDTLVARVSDGREVDLSLAQIIRAVKPNDMSVVSKMGLYVAQFWDFLSGYPREANTEGGILPAIFGTVTMVFVMSIIVSPFGVLAAIYLREYARQGPLLRMIRISVYNLAGVPSIVFGVFGLGFFVYFVGGAVDQQFFPEALPSPTFGTPGLLWASLTLALLTLPVVIVATEEGLARIPSTIRHGSLALGATKAETLWKVVVPLATPAMMTGLILAIARAAGEVAPLMLVGVVKLAPTLPVDGNFPFIHLERKIMHLGFHIFDVGFQSPNVEAAQPLVYATAMTLVVLIVMLNLTAISIRNRLREKYRSESD